MILGGDITHIYVEFIRIYLQLRWCQNVYAPPADLVVAGDPRSIANRATNNKNNCWFALGQRGR